MSTATRFRRLTVEEVRRAKEATGATIARGLCLEWDEDVLCGCPIGVVARAEHGYGGDDTEDAARLLGLQEAYWSQFVEAFDRRRCPPPADGDRWLLGDEEFAMAMAGWQDGRAIARDLFGEEAAS